MISIDSIQKLKLAPAGKTALPVLIHLVDGKRQSLCAGITPKLPDTFKGRTGERLDLVEGSRRTLVVGCGNTTAAGTAVYWESVGAQAVAALHATGLEQAQTAGALPSAEAAQSFCVGALLASYSNKLYRKAAATAIPQLRVAGVTKDILKRAEDLAASMNWARALVDAPPNHLTPLQFARESQTLSSLGVDVKVLNVAALEKLGAHALLSVGKSSAEKPCMVVAQWNGRAGKGTDLAIVGKGLTFDGGGLNLKTVIIEKMKLDKGGAAAAIAALRVLALRKAKINVVVVLVLAENVIGPDAYRPGDVISSLAGISIEVANTDAEGRIVLADGLTYAQDKFKPKYLVDIATLTGAIAATFHQEFAGLFANDEPLAHLLEKAASETGDLLWRMPLSPLQDYVVESEIADVKNVGAMTSIGIPGYGSSIAGAKFLEKFTTGSKWAHLDMASTVLTTRSNSGLKPGPSGWGVKILDRLASFITEQ